MNLLTRILVGSCALMLSANIFAAQDICPPVEMLQAATLTKANNCGSPNPMLWCVFSDPIFYHQQQWQMQLYFVEPDINPSQALEFAKKKMQSMQIQEGEPLVFQDHTNCPYINQAEHLIITVVTPPRNLQR